MTNERKNEGTDGGRKERTNDERVNERKNEVTNGGTKEGTNE